MGMAGFPKSVSLWAQLRDHLAEMKGNVHSVVLLTVREMRGLAYAIQTGSPTANFMMQHLELNKHF